MKASTNSALRAHCRWGAFSIESPDKGNVIPSQCGRFRPMLNRNGVARGLRPPAFLPLSHRPSPRRNGSALPRYSAQRLQSGVSSRGCSHSIIFRPPSLLPPRSFPPLYIQFGRQGGRGVYARANRSSLPPRASGMLAVRDRAIDGRGLSPPRSAALQAATYVFESNSCARQYRSMARSTRHAE